MINKEEKNNIIKIEVRNDVEAFQSIKDRLNNLNEKEKMFLLPLYAAVCSERDFRITDLHNLSQTKDIAFEKKDKYISYDLDLIEVCNIYKDILTTTIGKELIDKSMVPKKDQ